MKILATSQSYGGNHIATHKGIKSTFHTLNLVLCVMSILSQVSWIKQTKGVTIPERTKATNDTTLGRREQMLCRKESTSGILKVSRKTVQTWQTDWSHFKFNFKCTLYFWQSHYISLVHLPSIVTDDFLYLTSFKTSPAPPFLSILMTLLHPCLKILN